MEQTTTNLVQVPFEYELSGNHSVTIDPKLRLPIPAKFRSDLSDLIAWEAPYLENLKADSKSPAANNATKKDSQNPDDSILTLYVSLNISGRVGIFTPLGLARFRQRLRNLPELSAEAEELKSTMQGWTFKTDTDKQYRIKLNPELCKIADLSAGQQITAVGRDDFLEIWDKDEWDARSRENLKNFASKLRSAKQNS